MAKTVTYGLAFGIMLATTIVWTTAGLQRSAQAQTTPARTPGNLQLVKTAAAQGGEYVIVLDQQKKVLASYLVNAQSGQITLASIRNIQWDLQLEEYNGNDPKPRDVRALLDKR